MPTGQYPDPDTGEMVVTGWEPVKITAPTPNIDTYTDKGTGEIVAIDKDTGEEVWRVDPGTAKDTRVYSPELFSRFSQDDQLLGKQMFDADPTATNLDIFEYISKKAQAEEAARITAGKEAVGKTQWQTEFDYTKTWNEQQAEIAKAKLDAEQQQWQWQKAWTQLQGSREQQLREAELAQTRDQYLSGLQAAPRSWIKYWQEMHPATYREPEAGAGFVTGQSAEQMWGQPAAIPGSTAGARMAAPTQAPGGSWMPNANPLPPTPQWMQNIPVSYDQFKVPSTQQWQRMLPSEQQGYFGLTDYLGKPEIDVIGQMRNLWPQWASKRGVAQPAYQRR